MFDTPAFNASLFFPRPDRSPPPPGARDGVVEVAGARLHLRLYDAPAAKRAVLLFHGNGEVVADHDGLAPRYLERAGSALAVVDYRGYGASTGTPTLRACLEDAPRVLEATLAQLGGRPLVVMGRSLGGACAAELCQQRRPGVVGYVFESAAADLQGVIRRRGLTLERPLSEAELAAFDPLRKLAKCTTPALVLHGEADQLIPVREAQLSFEALRGAAPTLVRIAGHGHNDLSLAGEYWDALARFVASLR